MVMGVLSSSILFKYESSGGHLFVLGWPMVRRVALRSCFGVMCPLGSGAFALEKGRFALLPLPRNDVRGDCLKCLAM